MKLLFLALLAPCLVESTSIQINNNTIIDYLCEFHNNTRYSTGIVTFLRARRSGRAQKLILT